MTDPKATEPTCQHREWLETDEHFPNGPVCGKPATNRVCDETDKVVCAEHKCRCNLPLVKQVKATEPSDEEQRLWEIYDKAGRCYDPIGHVGRKVRTPGLVAVHDDGHASRDAEVEALKTELKSTKERMWELGHEQDKLHAALAWFIAQPHASTATSFSVNTGTWWVTEPHDCTPAGRAAALVRLFERCGDGK